MKRREALVAKLRQARERIRVKKRRCQGRKLVPAEMVAQARPLARKNPRTGERRSLGEGAAELAKLGPCDHLVSPTSRHPLSHNAGDGKSATGVSSGLQTR
jgi:hypothetical protein